MSIFENDEATPQGPQNDTQREDTTPSPPETAATSPQEDAPTNTQQTQTTESPTSPADDIDTTQQILASNDTEQPLAITQKTAEIEEQESAAQIDQSALPELQNVDDTGTHTPLQTPAKDDTDTHIPPQTSVEQTSVSPAIEQVSAPSLSTIPFMEFEDLLSLKIASDPQISPDGKTIAFVIQQCDATSDTTSSAIWLVDNTTSKVAVPRQITRGDYHDTTPRWSPDGRTLAFLSDREGNVQIFLLPLAGGEAHRLSQLAQAITEYSWHPNGQIMLVHSAWKPQDDQQTQASKQKQEQAPIVYTRLGARHDGEEEKLGRHQQLWLIPLEGNAMRLTSEPVDLIQSCWSPDGREIVFSANRRSDTDLTVSMALWVLTLASGQLRRLTPEEGLAQMPSWSPDGDTIAYLYTIDETEASNIQPWIVAAQGNSSPRLAVPGADALTCQSWIIDELRDEYLAKPVWYPDSQSLLVSAQECGQLHLYRLDLAQQQMQRLTGNNGRYISPQISQNGQTITLVRADWFTPGDIWSMDSAGKQPRKLTRVNDALLQSHQLVRPKRIHWRSFDNQEIEGWLYLPPQATSQKTPLIVMAHGGPSLAWGDGYVHEFQVLAGHGYAILAPNPRGSAGYGEAFSRSVLNDWGGDDFKDLMAGIDYVIENETIDPERLGISGMSYGGYMTNLAITKTTRFKAAVSRNGISSLTTATWLSDQTIWFQVSMDEAIAREQRSPLNYVHMVKTPLLLLHAEDDLRCPFNESYQFFVALRKGKHPVELVKYPHTSHMMDWPTVGSPRQRIDRLQRTFQWLQHFV